MPTTDWILCSSARTIDRGNTADWTSVAFVTNDNPDEFASTLLSKAGSSSDWLVAEGFSFTGGNAIPSGALINGIEVRIAGATAFSGGPFTSIINVGKDDSTLG